MSSNKNNIKKNELHKKCLEIQKKLPKDVKKYFKHFSHGDHNTHSISMCRTNINLRCCIPYSIFKNISLEDRNKILFDKKQYFDGGLVIDMTFNEYLEISKKDDRISIYLKNELHKTNGSTENVTVILGITNSKGYSGSSDSRKEYKNFKEYSEDNKELFTPLQRTDWTCKACDKKVNGKANKCNCNKKCNRRQDSETVTKGNDKFSGNYYVNISGGNNSNISIPENIKSLELFNNFNDYCSEKIMYDREAVIIYRLLHADKIFNYIKKDELDDYKEYLEDYLSIRIYDNGNLLDISKYILLDNGEKIQFIKDDILISPLTNKKISINDTFGINGSDPIQYCHNNSVSKNVIRIDSKLNEIMTSNSPINFFLDFKSANRSQGEDTIQEYFKNLSKIACNLKLCVSIKEHNRVIEELKEQKDKEIEELKKQLEKKHIFENEE